MSSIDARTSALALRRRALRFVRRGELRKAIVALREAVVLEDSGQSHVRLAHVLQRAGKQSEALHALRQALYAFRHDAMRGRARTVARLILKLDPQDAAAQRRAA
jgi:Tfp pilus assembly protein PilF